MLIIFIRTMLLYVTVVIVMRIMGKRQIGELQPYELVVALMISELAALPMEDTGVPLLNGIIPIITLLIAQLGLSYLTLKSDLARRVVCGIPSILVENSKIKEPELVRLRYNLNDLLEQLRSKGYPNIADVEFAILETNGELSVIPKSQKRPISPDDLNIPTSYEGLPSPLIVDGVVHSTNLEKCQLDQVWLEKRLAIEGIHRYQDVLFASLDTNGQLYIQLKAHAQQTTNRKPARESPAH